MAATTPIYALPYPELAVDDPNIPRDIKALADATEAALGGGAVTVGVPSAAVTLNGSAWTDVCTATVTVGASGIVEVVAWARVVNSGAGRAMVALQILDGATHKFGTGQTHIGGTSDTFGDELTINTARRRLTGITPGSHTFKLQAYKDANGSVDVKKTDTYASQAIAVTGIEVSPA